MLTIFGVIGSRCALTRGRDHCNSSIKWRRRNMMQLIHFATALLLVAAGCSGSVESPAPHERVSQIYSNIGSALYGDDSIPARAWAVDSTGGTIPGLIVTLSALTPSLATISSTGVIHVRGTGLALFLATTDGFAQEISFQVFSNHIARIVATPDSLGLVVGQQFNLADADAPVRVRAFDTFGNDMQDVSFYLRSSNPGVVHADDYRDDDEISMVGVGSALITARADNISTTIQMTVSSSP